MNPSDIVLALKALAQESRLLVFRMLVEAGPDGLTPSALSDHLKIAPATLSFHLKELSWAGLIEKRQAGRNIHYSANLHHMCSLMGFLTENYCGHFYEETGLALKDLIKEFGKSRDNGTE